MNFQQAQTEYRKLKAGYDAGRLSEEALRDQVAKLLVEDDQGRWWSIGYETGQWYVHDGVNWVEGVPPEPQIPAPEPQVVAQAAPAVPVEQPGQSEPETQPPPEKRLRKDALRRPARTSETPQTAVTPVQERRKSSLPLVITGIAAVVIVGAFLLAQLLNRQPSRATTTRVASLTAEAQSTEIAETAVVQAAVFQTATAERAAITVRTQTAVAANTAVAIFTQSPKPTASLTAPPSPEPTAPSTAPPSPSQASPPSVIPVGVVNVRTGPGTNYPVIGQLTAGQSANITGRNAGGDWWQIDYNNRAGWVAASVAQETIDAGAVIPVVADPPTPTPRPTVTPASPLPGRLAFQRTMRGLNQIFTYDMGAGKLAQLTSAGENHHPRWSADGDLIAFASNSDAGGQLFDIWMIASNGQRRTRIVSFDAWDEYPAWSDDGTLAFVSTGVTRGTGNSEIFVGKPGSDFARLTENTSRDEWPSWSPEGKRIVFSSERDGTRDIWIMNRDGSRQQSLVATRLDENEPAWSPGDSNLIAYTARANDKEGQFGDIYLYSYDTRERAQLTRGAATANPTWSPDGRWLAFTQWADSNGNNRVDSSDDTDLWAINIATREQVPLLVGPGIDSVPSWTR